MHRLITLDHLTIVDAASDFYGEENVPRKAITMGVGSIMKSNINVEGESVILIHEGELYSLSDVGLKCMSILGGIWTPLSYLRFIPKSFRDSVYNLIARNRYRWFGKSDVCMVPDSKIQSLFL